MTAFVVLLHPDEQESSDKLRASIEAEFPDSKHFKFSETAYLVTGANLTNEVTKRIGVDASDDLYAAVLRLNGSYSGNSWARFWEWLKAAEEAG